MSVIVVMVVIAVTMRVCVRDPVEVTVWVFVLGARLRRARQHGGSFVTIGLHAIEPGGQLRKHGHAF